MSGIFGVLDPEPTFDIQQRLDAMATLMTHQDWYVVESLADAEAGLGLGRIGIGILNQPAQPIWNADKSLALVMAGEFYDVDALKRDLPGEASDEALALHLFETQGSAFAREIEGAFILAIWDRRQHQVVVMNDRFGLYPTYLAQAGRRLLIAPEVKALLLDPAVDRSLRDDALAEWVRFQRMLGTKTLFAGINLLPAASVLTYDCASGSVENELYWRFHDMPIRSDYTVDGAIEEGSQLWRHAVEKMVRPDERIGVFLSGGLDARGIVSYAKSRIGKVHSFTFGHPESNDVRYAAQIAQAVQSEHHLHPYLDGHWIKDYADQHLALTEGFQPWIHMHGLSMLAEARETVDINLSGLGDLIWINKKFTPPELMGAPDDTAFTAMLYERYKSGYSWPGLSEGEANSLYTPAYDKRLKGLAYESFLQELQPYESLPIPQRVVAFNHANHFSRHLIYHAVSGRAYLEYRLPFFDLALQTFCYALPYQQWMHRKLEMAIIERDFPALARIPSTLDDLPLTNRGGVRMRAWFSHKFRHYFNRYVRPAFPELLTLYADYEGWLRSDLRDWAAGILLSDEALAREIFRPEALHSLLNRHNSGIEEWTIGKISQLITLEMTLRKFYV